jgi:hypothetical protein
LDDTLFVVDHALPHLAGPVSGALGSRFGRDDILDAIRFCFERPSDFVSEFVAANFSLEEPAVKQHLPDAAERDARADEEPSEHAVTASAVEIRSECSRGVAEEDSAETYEPTGLQRYGEVKGDEDDSAESLSGRRGRGSSRRGQFAVLEDYARSIGLAPRPDGSFEGPDSVSIRKTPEGLFPWALSPGAGADVRYLMPIDHCIETEPIELAADIWYLLQNQTDRYSLIVRSPAGAGVELSGRDLVQQIESDRVRLYPASYRLIHKGGESA